MSDVDWDADDFEPADVVKAQAADQWIGEDDDESRKDDDAEENKEENGDGAEVKATQVKKKKSTRERLAEKEAKRKRELEEKRKEAEEALRIQNMSTDQKLAEKLRQQKVQEESDLQIAVETFGVDAGEATGDLTTMNPTTKEDFDKFGKLLKDRITKFETSGHYVTFLENLYRDLSLSLEADDIKKLGSLLNTLGNEKTKVQKGAKSKKKSKQKATINAGKDDNYDDYTVAAFDGMEDFI